MKKRVLITGASRGIGKATAQTLSNLNYKVIGTSRSPDDINNKLPNVEYVPLDLLDDNSIDSCIQQVGAVDVLINNAGISQIGPAEEIPIDEYKALFQVNLFGLLKLTQGFLPSMRKQRNGLIINMSSLAGKFAVPFQSSYVASKFALEGMSWSLRQEVKPHGITVVVIEPNDINTAIDPEVFVKPDSDYKPSVEKITGAREKSMGDSPGPEIVADKVLRIIKVWERGGLPAPFYPVGKNASLLSTVKRFVPDKIVEKLISSSYGLKEE